MPLYFLPEQINVEQTRFPEFHLQGVLDISFGELFLAILDKFLQLLVKNSALFLRLKPAEVVAANDKEWSFLSACYWDLDHCQRVILQLTLLRLQCVETNVDHYLLFPLDLPLITQSHLRKGIYDATLTVLNLFSLDPNP